MYSWRNTKRHFRLNPFSDSTCTTTASSQRFKASRSFAPSIPDTLRIRAASRDQPDLATRETGATGADEGAWIDHEREIAISDALPENFALDVAGHMQPIDLFTLQPDDEPWKLLLNMARHLPQHP